MFKLHAKKIHTKCDKICVCGKIHKKIILAKRNLELNNLGFLCFSKKVCPDLCPGLYRFIFQSLYRQNGKLMKGKIFETFARCSRKNLPRFCAFWHLIFKLEKESDRANEACCNVRLPADLVV